eukprot:1680029-Rhodomonas_salina.2
MGDKVYIFPHDNHKRYDFEDVWAVDAGAQRSAAIWSHSLNLPDTSVSVQNIAPVRCLGEARGADAWRASLLAASGLLSAVPLTGAVPAKSKCHILVVAALFVVRARPPSLRLTGLGGTDHPGDGGGPGAGGDGGGRHCRATAARLRCLSPRPLRASTP